ncbi:MAG: sugar transporter [Halanaerobium sp. MSAO_Bac5]|nr:MAG: sugar transporter [Halanaerobium sp. MSAO_Bac5]
MKKLFILLTLSLILIATSGMVMAEDIVIGMTANNTGVDSYQTLHDQAFREKADEMGVEYTILDARGEPMRQVDQIMDLMTQDVDVMVVWPVSGQAIVPVLRQVQQAGIPVLIANSKVDESGFELVSGFAGPDNITQGEYAAQMMAEALDGEGRVVEIMGTPGYITAEERSQGFHDEIEANYPGIEIIETQPADWNRERAQEVMENYLTKYDDGEIDGVYVGDDNMGVGAINAIRSEGRGDNLKMTSATMFADGYDEMQSGDILYGTLYQSPIDDANYTVEIAVKLARGEEVEFFNYFETPKVTSENIDEFERPVW